MPLAKTHFEKKILELRAMADRLRKLGTGSGLEETMRDTLVAQTEMLIDMYESLSADIASVSREVSEMKWYDAA